MPTSPITENIALLLVGLMVLVVIVIMRVLERRRESWRAAMLTIALTLAASGIVGFGLLRTTAQAPMSNAPAAYAAQAQPTLTATPGSNQSDQAPAATAAPAQPATALPSLTPTVSQTPIVLYTPIKYVSTYALNTPTNCSVTANQTTYLRGDPSEKLASIGTLIAGSLLNVIGRSSDGKWYEIVSNDDVPLSGWVRADYVTAEASCTDDAIPVGGPTATASKTPAATSAVASNTGGSAPASTPAGGTVGQCALIVTTAASLRPDPSLQHVPMAQLPELTALTATERSANGQWWHVTYNGQDGWVGAGVVLAERSCDQLPRAAASS